jgi:hypothetical protein
MYSPLQKFESTFKSFAADGLSISLDLFLEIAASLQQALTVWPSLDVVFKMKSKVCENWKAIKDQVS